LVLCLSMVLRILPYGKSSFLTAREAAAQVWVIPLTCFWSQVSRWWF
jgi:hypothetical protein